MISISSSVTHRRVSGCLENHPNIYIYSLLIHIVHDDDLAESAPDSLSLVKRPLWVILC